MRVELDLHVQGVQNRLKIVSGFKKEIKMDDRERYPKAKKVNIKLCKEWIGWHGAIHKRGSIMNVAKEKCNYGNGIRYFDAPGMGYPSLDIEPEYIECEVE